MARRAGSRAELIEVSDPAFAERSHRPMNLTERAYERIEELIVTCELRPGRFLAVQDLQALTGLGRTPVHQAVTRLAADTLIIVRPRDGLQIAPIDLARERLLLKLRRDIERFVIRLATERASALHRNQMLHMERLLRERREELTIDAFNVVDRRLDSVLLAAAAEPFLMHALRPLHTIFRRVGWIHYSQFGKGEASLHTTIDRHLAIVEAVAHRRTDAAMEASDALMTFMDSMFDIMEQEIDPSLLDCSITPILQR